MLTKASSLLKVGERKEQGKENGEVVEWRVGMRKMEKGRREGGGMERMGVGGNRGGLEGLGR